MSNSWHCPGGQTSGVDSPFWKGAYTWDGTTLNLTFECRTRTDFAVFEDGSVGTETEVIPVEFYVVMTCIEENEYGYYVDTTPLPLYSDLTGIEAGQVQMYVGENIDLDTLFP
jgi:hypothetical protein